ncbi:hypothetical protein [Haloactinomyces albus]|uniref:MFS family arabinose efflux permease n=1 Tax=Haloactinomyces albus TaxID=1352928 RepID=A0AAE3ZHB6_9ACTN|nr:hypothetical protein [Haloactinomyces albus]MDR7302939.1 putative MFS family arabinose efflux permease [Haloactinomyces albus]
MSCIRRYFPPRAGEGLVADLLGWRAIYLIIALILAGVLRAITPPLERGERISYPRLVGPVCTTIAAGPVRANGLALASVGVCPVGVWLAQHSIVALTIVVVILDVGFQSDLVLSQTCMISLPGSARSRLNTAVVVSNFLGGAIGSALAGPLWAGGEWAAIITAALIITVIGLLILVRLHSRLADLS